MGCKIAHYKKLIGPKIEEMPGFHGSIVFASTNVMNPYTKNNAIKLYPK